MKISFNCYNNPVLQNRVLAKSGVVSFKSRDLLELPEQDVFKKIEESIKPDNFLGQGTEAEVYRIKDTNYCIKLPYLSTNIYKSYSKELTPVDKVNHVVAKLGFGAVIMKYIEGIIPKWYMNSSSNRYKLQEIISEMPQNAYSDLLQQIANAIDNDMLFDFSGGNLVVDIENKKLTAIDFYGMQENPRPIKPLNEMYSVLTCYGSLEKTGKKIFDNITNTALEEFKPNNIPCMDVALFDFLEVCLKRMGEAYTPDSEKLKSTIMYKSDLLKKIKKQEILDKSVSEILEKNIDEFKILLKKVH